MRALWKPALVLVVCLCLLGVLFVFLTRQTGSTPQLGDPIVLPSRERNPPVTATTSPRRSPTEATPTEASEPDGDDDGAELVPPELDEVDESDVPDTPDTPDAPDDSDDGAVDSVSEGRDGADG